ncbi:hypothetical protein NBRC10513_006072 [Rhodotorula toruloides]
MQEPPQLDAVAPNRSKPNYVTPDRPAFWDDFPPLRNFKDPSELHPSELRARLRHPVCLYWFRITSQAAHALLTNAYPRSADEAAIPDEGIMFLTDDLNEGGVASDLVTALERTCVDEWMVFAPECLKTVDHIALPRSTPPPTDLPWCRPISSQAPPRPLPSAPAPNRPPPSNDSLWRRSSSSRLAAGPPRGASAGTPAPPPQQTSSARGRPAPYQPALSTTPTIAFKPTPQAPSRPNAWTSRRPAPSQPGLSLSTLSLADSPAVRPISTTTTRCSCKATLEQAQRVPLDRLFQLTGCKGYLVLSADAEEQTFFLEADEPRKLPLAKDVIDAHLLQIRAGEADAVKAEETVAACGNSGNKVRVVRLFDMDDLPGGLSGFKPL